MTLVEVMVAMLLGSVSLMGALALVGTLQRGSSFSRQLSEASALAQSKLEDLVVLTPMPADGTTVDPGNPLDAFGLSGATNAVYARQWTRSTFVDTNTSASRRRVAVVVTWSDQLGGSHTVTAQRERVP